MIFGMVLVSIVSGVLGAAFIAIVHRALAGSGLGAGVIAIGFVAVVLGRAATQFAAQAMLVRFGQDVILKLCRNLCDRVLAAPLDKLESMGSPRLLAALNDDVQALSSAFQAIPMLVTNFAVLVGCSAYLAWLSWPVLLLSILMVLAGVAVYRMLLTRAHVAIRNARDGRDRLFGNFRTLIEGIKELKLHRSRREDFLRKEIDETTEHLRRTNILAMHQYLIAQVWTQLVFFSLLGMLLFGGKTIVSMSTDTLTGYVFATLYMMSPIWSLMESVPTFLRGRVSLNKVRDLSAMLESAAVGTERTEVHPLGGALRIELDRVVYGYPVPAGEDSGFTLGPIDLSLSCSEVVFVTGGNGSGKSTLVKLLTGLYVPQSGQVRLNYCTVDDASREDYRQLFAAVFADFHLFDSLFGLDAPDRDAEIRKYLILLHMDQKVQVHHSRFSTTALSTGQRKRLALLTAYLEDRPVYVFDEWAADQDPEYKEIFYRRLLPDLRARGKAVVVITHDDRYFHLGDRVLKLEDGKIASHLATAV